MAEELGLFVEDSGGDGRPVVLIHGWPLSAEAWSHQVGPLVDAGYRVIAYDRRGFGRSEADEGGAYDYDTLADDLAELVEGLDLRDATLVGFSMGGGEVARYVARHGTGRLRSVVFAAAVPPCLMHGDDNPEGPLPRAVYEELRAGLDADRDGFFEMFATGFFSANGALKVSEDERQAAITLAQQSDQDAALSCMDAWATTDFRADLPKIDVPVLVIHGDADATVPFEGSGARTAAATGAKVVVLKDAPHGLNASHADAFNAALLEFLAS